MTSGFLPTLQATLGRSSGLSDRTSQGFKNGGDASLASCGQKGDAVEKRIARGLALIEAMVVIAVLGILAAIGVPNYSRYSMRASLVDAGTELAEYRTKMERFYQDNRTYAKDGACGRNVAPHVANFVITCTVAATGDSFTAAATGTGPSAGFVYTINQANVRATRAIPSHWGELPSDASHKWVTR